MSEETLITAEEETALDILARFKGDSEEGAPLLRLIKHKERRIYFQADRSVILPLCTYLRDSQSYEHASSVCGVDWETHMQVVYHLSNYKNGTILEIIVDIPNDDLRIDSVAKVWEGADWHERETYELFGIIFEGHPNLRRLLTPEDYEFFPFRRSYKLRGQEQ